MLIGAACLRAEAAAEFGPPPPASAFGGEAAPAPRPPRHAGPITGANPAFASSASLPHSTPAGVKPTELPSAASAPLPVERGAGRPQAALLARVLYWAPLLAACVAALLIGFVGGIVFSAPNAAGPELGRRLGPASPLSAELPAAPAPASGRHYNPGPWQALSAGAGVKSKLVPGAAAAGAAADAESMALLGQDSFRGSAAAHSAAADAAHVTEDGPAANAEQMFARALQNGHLSALGAAGPSAAPGDHFATGEAALSVPDVSRLEELMRRLNAGSNGTSVALPAREHVAIKDDQGKLLPLQPKLKARPAPAAHYTTPTFSNFMWACHCLCACLHPAWQPVLLAMNPWETLQGLTSCRHAEGQSLVLTCGELAAGVPDDGRLLGPAHSWRYGHRLRSACRRARG